MINDDMKEEWAADCMKWRGRVLTGRLAHWCVEWDGLPVDETTDEWACNCYEFELREQFSGPWLGKDDVVHHVDAYFYPLDRIYILRRHCDRNVEPEEGGKCAPGPVTCFGCMGST